MPLSSEIVFATVAVAGSLIVIVASAKRGEWVRVSAWLCFAVYSVLAHLFRPPEIPDWLVYLLVAIFVVLVVVDLRKTVGRAQDRS
jgi:drug/metabolite transporter (DMT)-like permease